MVKHVFEDPELFMQGIVKLCIDESNGATRDTMTEIISKMYSKLPFTVFSDFKKASSLNMYPRLNLMSKIIFT